MTCTVATGSIGSRNNTVPRLLRSVTRTLAPAVSPLAMRRRGDAWQRSGSMPGSIRPLAENHVAERQRPSPKTRPDLRFCGADDEI